MMKNAKQQRQTLTRRPPALRRNKKGGYLAAMAAAAVVVCLGGIFAFSVFAADPHDYVLTYNIEDTLSTPFATEDNVKYNDLPATRNNATATKDTDNVLTLTSVVPVPSDPYIEFKCWSVKDNNTFRDVSPGGNAIARYFADDGTGYYVGYAKPSWNDRLSIQYVSNGTSEVIATYRRLKGNTDSVSFQSQYTTPTKSGYSFVG